mgnify:FL=1
MKSYMRSMLHEAIKNGNVDTVKALYNGNPNDYEIKFEYARLLIDTGDVNQGKKMLLELLDTRNRNYALLELGKLAVQEKNINIAKKCFNEIIAYSYNDKDRNYALLELGIIESKYGNKNKARKNFVEILRNTDDRNDKNHALLELGRLEAESGNIEEAKKCFNRLISINKNSKDQTEKNTSWYAERLLVTLLFKTGEYQSLADLVNKSSVKVKSYILLYISKLTNTYFNIPYEEIEYGYTMNQILDYDEYSAIEHVLEGHDLDSDGTIFNPNIDIYKLFNDIQNKLTPKNKVNKLIFNDIYIIHYPNIGINNQEYLRVVTLPNTKNILTMYPINNKYDVIDDDYMEEIEHTKVKKLTIK